MNKINAWIIVFILFLMPAAVAGIYATYMHSAFKIGDGKDIDLNGNGIGNGTIRNVTLTNTTCIACNSTTNATLLTSGIISTERYGTGITFENVTNINSTVNPYSMNGTNITVGTIPLARTQTNIKTGLFTYNLATASGSQAVTGVGFLPKYVQIYAVKQGSNESSYGTTGDESGANDYVIYTPVGGQMASSTALSVVLYNAVNSSGQQAYIGVDADGFTLVWTKIGTYAGTGSFIYTAIR